jgi:hypothetical protein
LKVWADYGIIAGARDLDAVFILGDGPEYWQLELGHNEIGTLSKK